MAHLPEEPLQELTNGTRGWLAAIEREPHDAPRAVVDGDAHPPAEGPDLWQGEGNPRNPESKGGGNGRQVDMPEVVRLANGDDTRRCLRGQERLRRSRRAQHPADRGRAEVQTRTGQNPGDLDSPHGGAEDLQPPHDVANEVGEPIHRFRQPNESISPVVVEARRPGGDGEGSHEEGAPGLGEGPRPRGAELQDGQSLCRRSEVFRLSEAQPRVAAMEAPARVMT